ncbi:MAG: hypothetical protein KGD58_08205 [Candidatus Lokiarchaeota archaeon]|nr:hypothetical protein [Candidatus Lokiarchaeota archaeon]
MGLAKLEQIYQEIMKDSYDIPYENVPDTDIDYSEIVIPFSQMFNSYKPRDIYSGNERIPFKERKHEFKTILRREFSKF